MGSTESTMKGRLILEDGFEVEGIHFGANASVPGEVGKHLTLECHLKGEIDYSIIECLSDELMYLAGVVVMSEEIGDSVNFIFIMFIIKFICRLHLVFINKL